MLGFFIVFSLSLILSVAVFSSISFNVPLGHLAGGRSMNRHQSFDWPYLERAKSSFTRLSMPHGRHSSCCFVNDAFVIYARSGRVTEADATKTFRMCL